jgi:hypothetical protein
MAEASTSILSSGVVMMFVKYIPYNHLWVTEKSHTRQGRVSALQHLVTGHKHYSLWFPDVKMNAGACMQGRELVDVHVFR